MINAAQQKTWKLLNVLQKIFGRACMQLVQQLSFTISLSFSVRLCPKLLSQIYSCEQQNRMPWLPLHSYLPSLPTTTPFSFWLLAYLLGAFIFLSPKSPHQSPRSPGTLPSSLPVGEARLGAEPAEGLSRRPGKAMRQPFPGWEKGLNSSLFIIIGRTGEFWSCFQFGQFQTNLEWVEKRMHDVAA